MHAVIILDDSVVEFLNNFAVVYYSGGKIHSYVVNGQEFMPLNEKNKFLISYIE